MTQRGTDPNRLVVLCERLVHATAARQTEWRVDGEDVFVWDGAEGAVSITSRDRDGEPPYELGIYSSHGDKVEELGSDLVGDDEPAPWNEPLADLYRIARRSALRADDIIEALIATLPADEARAAEATAGS